MKRIHFLIFLSLCCSQLSLRAQEIPLRVLFDYNKSEIPDSSMLAIIRLMNHQHVEKVLIEGHCDSVGSVEYNIKLSERRAQAVKKLMTDNLLPPDKIRVCIGHGKNKPLNDNATEYERSLNRRVYITFYVTPTASQPERGSDTVRPSPTAYLSKENFKKGTNITLRNLLFDGGSHVILPSSFPELNRLVDLLKRNPRIEIMIEGHVCCTNNEPDGYDWGTGLNNLSEARAREVTEYLTDRGISPERLRYKGFGGTRKIQQDESTESLRRLNRRVELKVLKGTE